MIPVSPLKLFCFLISSNAILTLLVCIFRFSLINIIYKIYVLMWWGGNFWCKHGKLKIFEGAETRCIFFLDIQANLDKGECEMTQVHSGQLLLMSELQELTFLQLVCIWNSCELRDFHQASSHNLALMDRKFC